MTRVNHNLKINLSEFPVVVIHCLRRVIIQELSRLSLADSVSKFVLVVNCPALKVALTLHEADLTGMTDVLPFCTCTLQPERVSAARSELFEKDVCIARFVLRLSLSLQSETHGRCFVRGPYSQYPTTRTTMTQPWRRLCCLQFCVFLNYPELLNRKPSGLALRFHYRFSGWGVCWGFRVSVFSVVWGSGLWAGLGFWHFGIRVLWCRCLFQSK